MIEPGDQVLLSATIDLIWMASVLLAMQWLSNKSAHARWVLTHECVWACACVPAAGARLTCASNMGHEANPWVCMCAYCHGCACVHIVVRLQLEQGVKTKTQLVAERSALVTLLAAVIGRFAFPSCLLC